MKRTVLFILNPKAGHGLNESIVSLISNKVSKNDFETEIKYTSFAGHATEMAADAVKNNFYCVVAVGGDGTVNEVAQSLVGSQTALGIIPTGSGNGFARHFKIPLDIEKALMLIANGQTATVDSLDINGKFCINIAGAGFDAHVASLFAGYGKRGFLSYTKLVMREYFGYHEKKYAIEFDNKKIERNAFLISLANGSQFGNGARIAPLAEVSDGLMDIVIMKKNNLFNIPFAVAKIFDGTLHKSSFVEIHKSKSCKVSCSEEMITHIDGEPSGKCFEINASVKAAAIKLILPGLLS